MSSEIQTEIHVHNGLDSMCQPLRPGLYCASLHGDRTVCFVSEDVDTAELLVSMHGQACRIAELDPQCVLTRMNNLKRPPSKGDCMFIEKVLQGAAKHRRALAQAEAVLAEHLGCSCGDGSPVWDGISAAVRDGVGTAVDLLDLVGE